VVFVATKLTGIAEPELARLVLFWGLAVVAVPLLRVVARAVCRARVEYLQNTLILGGEGVAEAIERKLRRHPEYGLNLVGFVGTGSSSAAGIETPRLGGLADLPALVRLYDVERLIVAFPEERGEDVLETIRELHREASVQIDVVPPLYEMISPGVSVHTLEGIPVVGLPSPGLSRSSQLLKRGLDLSLGSVLLVLLSPLLMLFALWIKIGSRGPVFFRQVRIGHREQPFEIVKFRTMAADADERKADFVHLNAHAGSGDARMFKIPNDPRTTAAGRFLRRYSLDELPQLVNVIRGEMSLVGPRPLIPEEHREVKAWARRRIALKPGMTGLWQVSGSSRIGFSEMVDLDYLYVSSWSLWRDLTLLLKTIPIVLRGANESR
jgi:exopolysaccharide biosynthesis polyprenyl glycosylphosphotransferase